jgi:hypothetical protein
MKNLLFPTALILLIACGIAARWSLRHNSQHAAISETPHHETSTHTMKGRQPAGDRDDGVSPDLAAIAMQLRDTQPTRQPRAAIRPTASTANTADNQTEEDELDPLTLGRIALSYVGTDPDAEQYWEALINDPDVSAEDRKDLIEDLNESGFPDPDHPAAADLPLIEARIAIIERLAPHAMDQTNADAFKEALKDLKEMQAKLKPDATKTEAPTEPPR